MEPVIVIDVLNNSSSNIGDQRIVATKIFNRFVFCGHGIDGPPRPASREARTQLDIHYFDPEMAKRVQNSSSTTECLRDPITSCKQRLYIATLVGGESV